MLKWIVAAVVVVAAIGGGAWYVYADRGPVGSYRTERVAKGELTASITSTGTLEPEEVVDVGARVDGQILAFGTDKATGKPIDYRSNVEPDMLLAKIDDRLYLADLATAKAQLDSGHAAVTKAEAALEQTKAKLFQATGDWTRAQEVGTSAGISQQEMDQYKANYLIAVANVDDQKAAIQQAVTALTQYTAAVDKAQQNLDYCTIKSPVKGTIIDRRVNIGQTLASAMTTPSLFLIAKDLSKMQLWVPVNEADIGNVTPGQQVDFRVDARPGETFHGTVGKVRLNANMSQNVVTYTVEVNTDNPDGKLLPYQTAYVSFVLGRRTDVLVVPNAALRYAPTEDEVVPSARSAKSDGGEKAADKPAGDKPAEDGTLYVRDRKYVRPVRVRLGLTDGINTEVAGDGVADGLDVVTADVGPDEDQPAGTKNPFMPQWKRKK